MSAMVKRVAQLLLAHKTERENLTEFQIAVMTLLIGYFLGQSTDWIKFYFTVWRKKSAINGEIEDIVCMLQYKKSRIEEIAGMVADPRMIGKPAPGEISELMYSKHFSDISPYYSRKKRSRISTFYQTIETFNEGTADLKCRDFEDFNKGLVNLYYYALLSIEAAADLSSPENLPDLYENESRLMKANKEVECFCIKYKLLNGE